MKVHVNSAAPFLKAMIECLEKDPACITGWSCLVLPGLIADDSTSAERLAILDAQFTALDGAMLYGSGGDLVILYRGLAAAGATRLLQSVREAFDCHASPPARAYDIFQDWPLVSEEFHQQLKTIGTRPVAAKVSSPDEQAGIAHMTHVLEESKFSRTYRSPMTVMLVEDDPITARMAGKLLGQEHILITASNAYEAVVNYLLYAPELVFLDINLPDGSGFQVLDQLTACDPDAYIVMFSGNDAIDTIMDSRRRGAQGFVVKPFQRDRLKHFVAERERAVAAERASR